MNKNLLEKIKQNIEKEPYAKIFDIRIIELSEGHSIAEMKILKKYENFFSITHGGAIFSLMDVAFGSAANSYGTVAVALDININYIRPSVAGDILRAEAKEVSRGNTIATYNIIVKNSSNKIIASSQAVAFLKKDKLPFL
jgi:acyl-CoA thioesterase